MMRKYLLALLLVCTPALAEDINTVGIVSTGAIGNEGSGTSGNFRGSSGFEVRRPYATISCFDESAPNLASECALVYGAYDANWTKRKTASISVMQRDTGPNGYNVLRLNATYRNSGTSLDDVAIRVFGNHGITLCGVGDDDWFGYKAVGVRCQIYTAFGQQVDGTDFYLNSQFRSPDYTKGITLGYAGSANDGIVASAAATSGIQFWTHDGSTWGKRFSISPTGKFGFVGNLTPTYNGGVPKYINITIDGEEYQLIAYKKP